MKSPYQVNTFNGRGGVGFSNYNLPSTVDGGVVTCSDCNMKGHHAGSLKCPKQQSGRDSGGLGASGIAVGIAKAPVKLEAGPQYMVSSPGRWKTDGTPETFQPLAQFGARYPNSISSYW